MTERLKNFRFENIDLRALKKILAVLCFLAIAVSALMMIPPVNNKIAGIAKSFANIEAKFSMTWQSVIYVYAGSAFVIAAVILSYLFVRKASYKVQSILYTILITSLLLFISFIVYKFGYRWLESDLSSEMVLANLLAGENKLVTTSWYYSTELRLIYQQIFMVPLFKVFNNWALIRALTVFLNNVLLIGAYFFMMRQTKISLKWTMVTSIFLLLPINATYWNIVTFGGYYTWFLAMFFCLLGLFFILTGDKAKTGNRLEQLTLVLFCLLSLTLGITGIRSLMDIQVPLFLCCLFMVFLGYSRRQYELVLSIVSLVFAGIGYAINILLHVFFSFSQDLDATWDSIADVFSWKLGKIIWMFVEYFGFEANSILFAPNGILSAFSVVLTAVIFILAVKLLRKGGKTQNTDGFVNQFFLFFFLSSAIYHICLYQLIEAKFLTLRYFIPFLVLYIPVLAVLFSRTMPRKAGSHFLVLFILIAVFGHGTVKFNSLMARNSTAERMGYLDFLLENNFDFGFATSLNANVTTELANGAVEVSGLIQTEAGFKKYDWLSPVKYDDPAYHTGKTFLLLTEEEWQELRGTGGFAQKRPDFEDDHFTVLIYPSSEAIYREVLDR
jgi:hypothetical protein